MTRKRFDHLTLVEPTGKDHAPAAPGRVEVVQVERDEFTPRPIDLPDENLTPEERAYWAETVQACAGQLEAGDRPALTILVDARARHAAAKKQIADIGPLIKTPNGYPVHNPYLAILKDAASTILQVSKELGLTPGSRSRAKIKKPAKKTYSKFDGLKTI